MPGKAIGISMGYGYPGSFARNADCIIMQRPVQDSDTEPIKFGDPVILNPNNTYSKFDATGTADAFVGIAVREVKQDTNYLDPANGSYKPAEPCDVLERGSASVICNVGTPTAGGAVYVRITANAGIPSGVVGGFEAAADGGNTIQIPNAKWATGLIDSDQIAEVTILTRNNP